MKKILLLLLFIPLVSFGQETINLNVNSESTLRKGRTADEIALAVKREEGIFNMGKGIYKIVKVGKWKSIKKLFERCENQIQIFEKLDDDYAAIYSDAYIINDDGIYQYGTQISRKQINKPPSGNIYEDLIRKDNFIPALSVIYKTEIIKELGYYDESLIYEDYDMLLRLSKQYEIYCQKEIECCYRLHQTNMNYNLDKPMFLDSKIKMLFKQLNIENSNLEIGIVIKEKILGLCELLFMQKSKLLKLHIKRLRSEYNYGKLLYYSSSLRLNWKIYLYFRILVLKKDQTVTLEIK